MHWSDLTGGYSFRLCPADKELTEECFAATPIPFVRNRQRLRWANGTELAINGTYVTEGTHPKGSMWSMNPLPYSNAGSPPEFPPPCNEKQGAPKTKPANPQDCALDSQASSPSHGFYKCHPAYCDNTGRDYAFAANVSLEECVTQCHAHNCSCFDYNPTSTGVFPFTHCHVAKQPQHVVASGKNYSAYTVARPVRLTPPHSM